MISRSVTNCFFFFFFFVIRVVFIYKIEAYFYYRFFTFLILLVHLYKLSLVIFRCSQVSLLFQRQMLHFHFHMVVTINQTTSTEVTASLINPFVPNPPFLYGMLDTDLQNCSTSQPVNLKPEYFLHIPMKLWLSPILL